MHSVTSHVTVEIADPATFAQQDKERPVGETQLHEFLIERRHPPPPKQHRAGLNTIQQGKVARLELWRAVARGWKLPDRLIAWPADIVHFVVTQRACRVLVQELDLQRKLAWIGPV